jgi:hypothetical protein
MGMSLRNSLATIDLIHWIEVADTSTVPVNSRYILPQEDAARFLLGAGNVLYLTHRATEICPIGILAFIAAGTQQNQFHIAFS